jgi:hypothetical protein
MPLRDHFHPVWPRSGWAATLRSDHRLESRTREIRKHGSEGVEAQTNDLSRPLSYQAAESNHAFRDS